MNGLEALNKIQHDFGQLKGQELVSCYETIFNALKRLESIDNANPSDVSFIWLNQRITRLEDDLQHYTMVEKDKALASITEKELNHLSTIKQALLKAQEEHKALEIIKEKNVNMFGFKRDIKQLGNRFTYKYYQSNLGNYHSGFDIQELTEEEFELLKAVLE